MDKRHVVQLTGDQRADLEGRFCGRLTLRERNRVQVLLGSDAGKICPPVPPPLMITLTALSI